MVLWKKCYVKKCATVDGSEIRRSPAVIYEIFWKHGTWDILQYQTGDRRIPSIVQYVVPAIIPPLFVETIKLLKSIFWEGGWLDPAFFSMVSLGFVEGSRSFPAHKHPTVSKLSLLFLNAPPIPQEVYDQKEQSTSQLHYLVSFGPRIVVSFSPIWSPSS